MSKRKFWGLTVLVVSALLFMLWLADLLHWGKIPPGTVALKTQPPPGRTVTVQEVELPQDLPVLGSVISKTLTQVSPQVPGRVSRIRVEAGSLVKKGDPLVELSAPEFQARRQQAQAGAAQAQALLNQAAADYWRYQRLRKEEAVSPREFEAMESRYQEARAAAAQAQGRLKEAETFRDYTVVAAPCAGVVAERRVAPGDLAQVGQPLVSLYDPQELQVEGEVNDEYRPQLRLGLPVRLEVPAAGWQGESTLTEIFPISQAASRTFKVRTNLVHHPALVPGMFARLKVPLGQTRGLVIPRAALRQVGQLPMVEVLVEGRPTLRQIKLGRQIGDQLEVLSGLQAGEQVLLP